MIVRVLVLLLFGCLVSPPSTTSAESPSSTNGSEPDTSIIPSWVYSGARLRTYLVTLGSEGNVPCRRGTRIDGRLVASSPESLWLNGTTPDQDRKWKGPETRPVVAADSLSIPIADIRSIRVFKSGWGWIPTSWSMKDVLKLHLADGAVLQVKPVRQSADTFFVLGGQALSVPRTELEATRGLSRDEICRVEIRSGNHNLTGTGALIGLVGGVLLGFIATAVIGEAETDGALPAWGLIVGPFVGAVVGKCITVDDWSRVWP